MDNVSETNQTQAEPVINEKLVPQSQVNEIVGRAKHEAAERAVEAYKRQQAQSQSQNVSPQQQAHISEDEIKRMTGEEIKRHFGQLEQEAQERANLEAANRVVNTFKEKIMSGKDKYEDFEKVTGNLALKHYPNVVHLLADHVDNSADVLYNLAQNRDKLYRIEALSAHNPEDAIYEIRRLSDSIKANEQSVNIKHPNAPLSQQRPSNTGTGSDSSLSWADLKRKYKA